MDEDLIPKKDLLEETGISYGALYRWKRMKLLPDEWFIRRSTFTGHETFFPRTKMLDRVNEILKLKESMSLEEIAARFQPEADQEVSLTGAEAAAAEIAPPGVIDQYLARRPHEGEFSFRELLGLGTFAWLLSGGLVGLDEALDVSDAVAQTEEMHHPVVYLVRKMGVGFCVTTAELQPIQFDKQAKLILSVSADERRAELNRRLDQRGVETQDERDT